MATVVRLLFDYILSGVPYLSGDLVSINDSKATQLIDGYVADSTEEAITQARIQGKSVHYPDIDKLSHNKSTPRLIDYKKFSNGNIGTRILSGRQATFDNSTPKTFRTIIEIAADGFDAVRPIFANHLASTYTVSLCNARAIGAMTDDISSIAAVTVSMPSSGIVPVGITTFRRSYLVGNWTDLSSIPRTDGGKGALVAFDAYISTAGNISVMGNNTSDVFTGWATRGDRKYKMLYNNGDCVTTSSNFVSTTAVNQSTIVGMQYLSRGRVVSVFGIGDSIMDGRGTIIGEGFGVTACETVQSVTGIPFEWANCGWAGAMPAMYKVFIDDLITGGIVPDAAVYTIGSPNVNGTPITALQISTSKQNSAYISRICKEKNIIAIKCTTLPTNPAVKDYNSSDSLRIAYNTEAMAYPGDIILDLSTAISGIIDADGQVNMLAGSTTDNIHPNDTGNAILSQILSDALIKMV